MKTNNLQKTQKIQKAAAIIAALFVWQLAAVLLDQSLLLVSPVDVAKRLAVLIFEVEFWQVVLFSVYRIVFGFFSALISGTILAAVSAKWRAFEIFLWPYVAVIKATPVVSFIIISFVWLSSSSLSAFISFLMVFPVVYSNVLAGIKSMDVKLLEMAKVYRIPMIRRIIYIYIPQLRPFLISACSTALGLAWKSGIAAEVIGIPTGSIGEKLYMAKAHFETSDKLAWTVVIVALSAVFEKLFMFILHRGFSALERM